MVDKLAREAQVGECKTSFVLDSRIASKNVCQHCTSSAVCQHGLFLSKKVLVFGIGCSLLGDGRKPNKHSGCVPVPLLRMGLWPTCLEGRPKREGWLGGIGLLGSVCLQGSLHDRA